MSRFFDKLQTSTKQNNSLLCVGLDPVFEKIPEHLKKSDQPLYEFNKEIIDATADLVCAYKPNAAFYAQYGIEGMKQLERTINYIIGSYPTVPVILDSKRGDIGNTNIGYASEAFDWLHADAVTVNPYMGISSLEPLFQNEDKGVIVLCRTSNPEAAVFQNSIDRNTGLSLYETVALAAKAQHDKTKNVLLVVGATNPAELASIRGRVGSDMIFLVPGVGAQGGDIEKVMAAGRGKNGTELIINSSRDIIYSGTGTGFADASRTKAIETRDKINQYR